MRTMRVSPCADLESGCRCLARRPDTHAGSMRPVRQTAEFWKWFREDAALVMRARHASLPTV